MDLFKRIAEEDKLHPIFKMLMQNQYAPEREVLSDWANGFQDRDGKFIYEFQTTFESSMWELYIHAFLKELGAQIDFSHHAPDFVVRINEPFTIEATIAAPAIGCTPAYLHTEKISSINFNDFNRDSAIRILNSLSGKQKKFKDSYSKKEHVKDKPFVIALASFDQPFSHFSVNRSIMMVLYGVYFDEEATIEQSTENVIRYLVDEVQKNSKTSIPVGLFTNDEYRDVSAIIYSSLATWGKIRALADNPNALTIYQTFHPNNDSIIPIIKTTPKHSYSESLADGLHIFHNPYATHKLDAHTFEHERVAQYFMDQNGSLKIISPDDFLLLRQLRTLKKRDVV